MPIFGNCRNLIPDRPKIPDIAPLKYSVRNPNVSASFRLFPAISGLIRYPEIIAAETQQIEGNGARYRV